MMTGEEFLDPSTESFLASFEEEIETILRDSVPEGTPHQKSEKQEETIANRLPKEPRHGAQSPLNINKISFDNYISPSAFSNPLPKQPVIVEQHGGVAQSPLNINKISSDNSTSLPFVFPSSSPLLRKIEPPVLPKQTAIVELYGSPSQLEDAMYKHLRELMIFHESLRMHVNTHKNCQKLPYVAGRLRFLLCGILLPYVNRTAVRPYDRFRGRFLPPANRGMRIIKSESHPLSGELVVGPQASLSFPTSSEVNWTTPSHLVDLGLPIGTLEASKNGNPVLTGYLTNMVSPSLCYVGEELDNILKDIIKEFEVETGGGEVTHLESAVWGIRSIEVECPVVWDFGKFAIDAFNEACEMDVKKGEHNILQHFEVMECKYLRVSCSTYYFYIAIEAIEEGNPGAYIAEVALNLPNRARSLCKFVLTNYKPYGTLATSLFYLSSLEALGKTLCDLYEEKQTRLKALLPLLKDTQVPTAAREADRLEKIHVFTLEDLRQNLSHDTEELLPLDYNRKTNPARWTDPDNVHGSGMVRRVGGTTCGYDYYNPYMLPQADPK